jgi:hypothetical protein
MEQTALITADCLTNSPVKVSNGKMSEGSTKELEVPQSVVICSMGVGAQVGRVIG